MCERRRARRALRAGGCLRAHRILVTRARLLSGTAARTSSRTSTSGTGFADAAARQSPRRRRSPARYRSQHAPSGPHALLSKMTAKRHPHRRLGADVGAVRIRRGRRGGPQRDRPWRRLPGQPRPAPVGAVSRRRGRAAACLAPLQPHNPRPFRGDGWTVVTASPELFLARRGRRVWTMPDQGHAPAGCSGRARELARRTLRST